MKKTALLTIAILAAACLASAQEMKSPDVKTPETKYASNSFARLSFINGKAYIQRAADLGYEEGQVNMPVAEGDRIGTSEGQAEVYIGTKNYVRLDENTKIDILSLPKKSSSLIRLREWAGNIYLDINTLAKEKAVEVLTSDATFYILDKGLYRIDVKENKETEILVFSGMVEVSGEEGSILVKKDQRLTISDGRFPSRPSSFFAAADDAFDRFNESRSSKVNRQFVRKHLSGELDDFENELDEYGDWVDNSEFGSVWVPRGMASDWRPYSFGRWMWLSMAGWCWLPYEPWGWSTYHYGRWHWGFGLGWYWIPVYGWGPAWVNWWWDNDYFGWAPMSYWGYPGVIIDNFYYGHGWRDYRDYPYNSRALTVVHRDQLRAPDIRRVALGRDAIKSVGKINLTNRTLDVKPVIDRKISVEQIKGGKSVILRKSGEGGGVAPVERVKKGETPPPGNKTATGERTIRKKKGEEGGSDMTERSYPSRSDITGFPSSKEISREGASPNARSSRTGTIMDRFYRFFSGERGSLSSSGSISRNSSSRTITRGASAPPSSSRGSSGRSSGSRTSGGVRKK